MTEYTKEAEKHEVVENAAGEAECVECGKRWGYRSTPSGRLAASPVIELKGYTFYHRDDVARALDMAEYVGEGR
jgi:hypothetical protein